MLAYSFFVMKNYLSIFIVFLFPSLLLSQEFTPFYDYKSNMDDRIWDVMQMQEHPNNLVITGNF